MAKSALDKKRKQKEKEKRKTGRSQADKRRRRSRILIKLLRDLILIALVALLAFEGYHFFYDVFADEPVAASEEAAQTVTVRVDSGMSDLEVSRMLKKNGLVENTYVFFAQVKIFSDSGAEIQPGTYQLNTYMNGQEMIEVLTAAEEESDTDTGD